MIDPASWALVELGKSVLQATGVAMIGTSVYLGVKGKGGQEFEQGVEDRTQHAWIIGQTGVGKTTFLQWLMRRDMTKDYRVIFIENHGSASKEMLTMVPEDQKDKTLYFAPWHYECNMCFNPMKKWTNADYEKYKIAEELVESFEKIFGSAWGNSTEDIIRMAILANLELPEETTLWEVYLIITDEDYRKHVLKTIRGQNPLVEQFWGQDFDKVTKQNLNSPLNKLRKFLSNPYVMKVLCQKGKNNLDLHKVMRENHFIADLDRDRLTKGVADLLASFLITNFQISAFRRTKYDKLCCIYVDEFQNFVSKAFPVFLSECRKFKLSMTMSHQYIAQLPAEMIAAIKGNVGTYIAFRVGDEDSGFVAKRMKMDSGLTITLGKTKTKPKDGTERFENMANHVCCIRMMKGGRIRKAFMMKTPPPLEGDKAIAMSIKNKNKKDYPKQPQSPMFKRPEDLPVESNALGFDEE